MGKKPGIVNIIKSTFSRWMAHDPFRQSAIIAYYAIFSLPALLVLIINVIGFFFERELINNELSRQIAGAMGQDTATQVTEIIENANKAKAGLLPSIIAALVLISGATGVFVQLQVVLNEIWGVKQKKSGGIMLTLKNRLFSFGLILSIGFLLLVSLIISSVLAALSHWLEGAVSRDLAYVMYVVEFVVSLGVISVLFALMFKFLPDVKVGWRNIWVGAFMTSFLFILGKYGLSFYFGKANPGSTYGAAGSIILVLLWVSYSSMIVFFGAAFTCEYALAKGGAIKLSKNAELADPTHPGSLAPIAEDKPHADKKNKILHSPAELEQELNNLSLKRVVLMVQIKELFANLFRFRKKSAH
jgi:membrane protein